MHAREVVISKILPEGMKRELIRLGYTPKCIEPSKNLTTELRYHPDILTFRLPDGTWLNEENALPLTDKYPSDCIFNCVVAGRTLIYGNTFICEKYSCQFERTIKVKQGYVKCSTIVLNGNALITSDESIKTATQKYFDVLKVSNEGIDLNGYSCGFIGGCCGVLDETLVFTGDIKKHRDYHNIFLFASNYGFELCSLSGDNLYDYGGILPL